MTRRDVPGAAALQAVRHSLLASLQGKTPSLERMLDTADELAVGGFINDAEHVLRRALELYPANVEPKRELARLALETNDARRALHISLRGIEQHPNDLELHGMAAAAYERLGALDRGLESPGGCAGRRQREHPGQPAHGAHPRPAGRSQRLHRLPAPARRGDRTGATLDALTALGIALSGNGDHAEAIQLLSDVARTAAPTAARRTPTWRWRCCRPGVSTRRSRASPRRCASIRDRRRPIAGWGSRTSSSSDGSRRPSRSRSPKSWRPTPPWRRSISVWRWPSWTGRKKRAARCCAPPPSRPTTARSAPRSTRCRRRPPRPAPAAAAPAPRFIGDIKSFALPEVLEFLRLQHKTGSLVVSSRRGAGIVRLVKGQVTSASAPGVGRLGEALVARNIITRAQLDAALAQQRRDDNAADGDGSETLGDLLMRERPGDREPLTRVVFQQVLDALEEMLAWKEGAFSFHPGGDRGMPVIAFDLQNVMLEIMRLADERDATSSST